MLRVLIEQSHYDIFVIRVRGQVIVVAQGSNPALALILDPIIGTLDPHARSAEIPAKIGNKGLRGENQRLDVC